MEILPATAEKNNSERKDASQDSEEMAKQTSPSTQWPPK